MCYFDQFEWGLVMNKGVKLALCACLSVLATASYAVQYTKQDIAQAAADQKIQKILPLPITGMKVISSRAGIIFISDNGRFAFKGKLYDIWNGDQYQTIEEIETHAFKVDLDKMRIDVDTLNTVTLGQGSKQAVIFVDPLCPYCHELVRQALLLQDEYTFKIVFIGLLGSDSDRLVQRVACAKRSEDVLPAMLSETLDRIETASCDYNRVEKTTVTGNVLGIRTVPYLLSPNGTTRDRTTRDLRAWLAANS